MSRVTSFLSRHTPPVRVDIRALGRALPSRLITADELVRRIGDPSLAQDAGGPVRGTRYWCATHESTADLAEDAALEALDAAALRPDEVDVLIVATDTPEFLVPSTASVVHARLGLQAVALDIAAVGEGFVPALDAACRLLHGDGVFRRALVIGVSAMSRFLDDHDARTASVFADGAAAMILEAVPPRDGAPVGVLATALPVGPAALHTLGIHAGGARNVITPAVAEAGVQTRLRWTGAAETPPVDAVANVLRELLAQAGLVPADVQHWLWAPSHEAHVAPVMQQLGVDTGRAFMTLDRFGFTGPACLPLTCAEAARDGRLVPEDVIVMAGCGASQQLGAAVVRWSGG